jgi:hypothetical protein
MARRPSWLRQGWLICWRTSGVGCATRGRQGCAFRSGQRLPEPARRLSWLSQGRLIGCRASDPGRAACWRQRLAARSRQWLSELAGPGRLSWLCRRRRDVAPRRRPVRHCACLVRDRRWQRRADHRRVGSRTDSPACSARGRRRLALQRGRLARAIGNFDDVRRVVDLDPVVDVDEDHVVRRRHDVSRRLAPDRNRHVDRNRQHEEVDRRQRRRKKNEIRGGRRQKVDRRRERRCEPEFWIVEGQHRPIDIDALVRWRRRHVVVDHRERRRRLERSGEIGEAALRVGGVRPARIAPQVAPIGVRRINHAGPAPSDGLASGGDDGAHPRGHGIIRIGREEIEITLQRCQRAAETPHFGAFNFPHLAGWRSAVFLISASVFRRSTTTLDRGGRC